MKKYLVLIICLGIIKLFDLSFFTKEINIYSMVSGFAGNLYKYDQSVSAGEIVVLDYRIDDNKLIIEPASSEVILPINGLITEIKDNSLTIQNSNTIYKIYNVDPYYRLYQYYNNGSVLGRSDEFIIDSNNNSYIVSFLKLNYEAI